MDTLFDFAPNVHSDDPQSSHEAAKMAMEAAELKATYIASLPVLEGSE